MRLGFIGLGNIGAPMAARLLECGFSLTVHDRVKAKAEPLLEQGARWAPTLADAVTGVDTLITSLPGPDAVRQVFQGANGLAGALRAGQTWIEMSTSDKTLIRTLAGSLADKGAATLEATVTCGVSLARSGGITVLVGGDRAVFERHRPLLDALARKVVYLGALGNATAVKLITNMLAFVHEAVLAEGLILGKRAGVELGPLLEAIQSSYAGSFVAEVDGPRVLSGTYESQFALELALKDMRLTHALADELGVPLEVGAMATRLLEQTEARYGSNADTLLLIKRLEEETGTHLQA